MLKEEDQNQIVRSLSISLITREREKMEEAKEDDNEMTTTTTISIDEYTPDEIMELVESSSPSPTTVTKIEGVTFSGEEPSFRVRFIDDPYAIPVVVQSYSGYVTIDVNDESCGPSFSDSDASAMASVDVSGFYGGCYGFNGGAWSASEVGASECGECEWDDDLLARFLGEDCV